MSLSVHSKFKVARHLHLPTSAANYNPLLFNMHSILMLIKCALAIDKKVKAILKAQYIVVTCLCNAAIYACLFKFLLSNIHNSKVVLAGPRFFQKFTLPSFWHYIMINITYTVINCNTVATCNRTVKKYPIIAFNRLCQVWLHYFLLYY